MIKFFMEYLLTINVPKEKILIRLQLYKDMNVEKEMSFWSNLLNIPKANFRKSYIKKSSLINLTYKTGFGHGTCSLMVYDVNLYNYVISSLKYLKIDLS